MEWLFLDVVHKVGAIVPHLQWLVVLLIIGLQSPSLLPVVSLTNQRTSEETRPE